MNEKSAYQLISELKAQQQWAACLALFDRAWTLDYYYRLYSLILKYEPQRKYGYKQRILGNSLIISQMGGGILPLTKIPSTRRLESWSPNLN
ncbi:MAG: hypothetical protein U0K81_07045 [Paludibacteraceae bacterium]|nr:hypothetical protein [Paludibacteraceae bacterium]